ncbi:MAG: DUF4230 domain-containing protein [Kiritimatiellia bacterium]
MNTLIAILAGFTFACMLWAAVHLLRRGRRGPGARVTTSASAIERLKAIGQLSVFKVLTKEIVTEVDHSWGAFGSKYLSWILSGKKMAMIFEFEIDFRYDLHSPDFKVKSTADAFVLTMPPCMYEIHIRDIQFYDEQKSKLVPWLLPDLLNTLFTDGFSEQDRNRLKDAAKNSARQQAQALIGDLRSDVEQSARQTLKSLARAFGVENPDFVFQQPADQPTVVAFAKE